VSYRWQTTFTGVQNDGIVNQHISRYEEIHEENYVGRGFNAVSHYKLLVSPGVLPTWRFNDGPFGQQNFRVPLDKQVIDVDPVRVRTLFPWYANNLIYKELGVAALNEFSTQVPTEVSIANFLFELREIKSLVPKITRSLSKTAAGGVLNFEFGWKPLLSDLRKLYYLTDSVNKRLRFLRSSHGKPVRLGYQRLVEDTNPLETYIPQQYRFIYKRTSHRGVFHAHAVLLHELEGLDDAIRVLGAFSAALGLNNPLQIVWNALPYSFVVDWFANIGGLLDRLAIQPFQGRWDVQNVNFSVKETITFESDAHFYPTTGFNARIRCGGGTASLYVRQRGLPVDALDLFDLLHSLSTKQQGLLWALLIAGLK
jgi:hypothetical protein